MVKLLRTIRLDASDGVVFARAAAAGEWAVTGTFLFADRAPDTLSRKDRIAFRTGFLGIESFGFSTLVEVAEASAAERGAAELALAAMLCDRLGAPDRQTALGAAREEIGFAESLAAPHPPGTAIALHREAGEDGGVRERFRSLKPRVATPFGAAGLRGHARAFDVVESDAAETPPVDLVALLRGGR